MYSEQLDNNIYKILFNRGISQIAFAKTIGIDSKYLNQIINQNIIPRSEWAIKIARGLGKMVSEVFFVRI